MTPYNIVIIGENKSETFSFFSGMNLVAKEFVACQINPSPGVLIVSPFAGAGEMMHEALICNPYEIDDAAEMIHRFVGAKNFV